MVDNKTYHVPDSDIAVVSESLGAYTGSCEQIVLTIPKNRDASMIRERVNKLYAQLLAELDTEQEFYRLRRNWESETGLMSNPSLIVNNSNFLAIVKMGKDAIPYILKDIEDKPSLLFLALEKITGNKMTIAERNGMWNCINVKDSCKQWIEALKK